MANYLNSYLAALLNDGKHQILPVSKAQLIELANGQKGNFGEANDVAGALTYLLNQDATNLEAAKTYTTTSINALNSTYTARTGYVLTGITETAGVLTAYTEEWLDASKVSYNGESNVKSAIEAIQSDLADLMGNGDGSIADQISDALDALDLTQVSENGKPITYVSQLNGQVSAGTGNIDAQYVDVDNSENKFNIAGQDPATTLSTQETFEHLQSEIEALDESAARYTLSEVTASVPDDVLHRYQLTQTVNGTDSKVGNYIDVPKDKSLVSVQLGHTGDSLSGEDGSTHESASSSIVSGTGADALVFVHQLANGNYKLTTIDVSSFLRESEFGDGLQVTNGVVSVKRDSTSEAFLTVGDDGVKLSGVQSAIDTSYNNAKAYADGLIADLDSEVGAEYQSSDLAYVLTGVSQANGELNSYYAVALDDAHVKTTFAATDDPVAALVPTDGTNPTNVKEALDLIASSLSALKGTAPIDTITGDNDNTYVNITAQKTGSTVALTVDDSALGNVAKLHYDSKETNDGISESFFNNVINS